MILNQIVHQIKEWNKSKPPPKPEKIRSLCFLEVLVPKSTPQKIQEDTLSRTEDLTILANIKKGSEATTRLTDV